MCQYEVFCRTAEHPPQVLCPTPRTLSPNTVLRQLAESIQNVRDYHPEYWELAANERTIAGAIYAELLKQPWPPGYDVDTEWSSHGARVGAGAGAARKLRHGSTTQRAIPDIIVHRRTQNGFADNLLIVEIKRGGAGSKPVGEDMGKVIDLMGYLDYRLGATVALGGVSELSPSSIWWTRLLANKQWEETLVLV